jgi:hypothetical protein
MEKTIVAQTPCFVLPDISARSVVLSSIFSSGMLEIS